jgi:hypothetical protein
VRILIHSISIVENGSVEENAIIRTKSLPISLLLSVVVFATPMVSMASGAVSQGFSTNDKVVVGSLVGLKAGDAGSIQLSSSDEAAQLVGVVADKALVALNAETKQTEVVTSGLTAALVSDVNGEIKVGDKITASPIKGVGMKAKQSSQIVGISESDFPGTSHTTRQTITDKDGKSKQVKIGTIPLQVNVSYYNVPQDKLSSYVPTFLVNVGSSIAGKDISPIRVLISFFCLLMGFALAGIMLYAGVRSGMISVGRNPLAHDILRRSLVDVLITSIGVLLITGLIFYLALTF